MTIFGPFYTIDVAHFGPFSMRILSRMMCNFKILAKALPTVSHNM